MEEYKRMHLPRVGRRVVKTVASCFVVALIYQYLLGGRNPCFACIGAVYGMGSQFQEGFHNGFNRFVGTLLGGMMAIPFYWLCQNTPFGIPSIVYMAIGVFCVIYLNLAFGANNAIQPGTVVYFVVMYTQPAAGYVGYTIARIIDTGVGVLISLFITMLRPSEVDKVRGISFSRVFHSWRHLADGHKKENHEQMARSLQDEQRQNEKNAQ